MTLGTITVDEVEYLEQLHRLEGRIPDVDEDARWGLTVAGLHVVVGPNSARGFYDEPVTFRHGRWIVVPR